MSAAPLLEVHQLHKSYGPRTVLHDVSLQLDAGKVMCVIGPSGSGKSTLLKCINHLERVDGGFIRVGEELIGYSYGQAGCTKCTKQTFVGSVPTSVWSFSSSISLPT